MPNDECQHDKYQHYSVKCVAFSLLIEH
jgi:hypothetical protein